MYIPINHSQKWNLTVTSYGRMSTRRKAAITTLVVLAALAGTVWYSVGYYYDSWHVFVRALTHQFLVREFFPTLNPLGWTPVTYLLLTLTFIVGVVVAYDKFDRSNDKRTAPASLTVTAGLVVLSLLAGVYTVSGWSDNAKDEARSYLGDGKSVVRVEDAGRDNLPASLQPLIKGGKLRDAEAVKSDPNGCLYATAHDVPSCITQTQGAMPANWSSREASLTGASIVMNRTSGAVPNTDVMDGTLTYLHGDKSWTAIRKGKKTQPLDGVVSWDGTNDPQTCSFKGGHSIDYTFEGTRGRNLHDTLADKYPGLLYEDSDMWGFCRGEVKDVTKREPVIVIPVTEEHSVDRRTTRRAAGVLVITGTSSGEPRIVHRSTVAAGTLPGPVYPLSLVAKQRDMINWMAGEANENEDRTAFGYKPVDLVTEGDNNSEFLMQDKTTGRLVWLTPLTPRKSKSQLITAYSFTSADEVTKGELNTQTVYVLPDNDSRVVNIDDMEARVSQALRKTDSGFFSGDKPGKISEFLPVDAMTWQAFAELNGRVVSRITVSADTKIVPVVKQLDGSTTPSKGTTCTKVESELSDKELADCIKRFTDELVDRK